MDSKMIAIAKNTLVALNPGTPPTRHGEEQHNFWANKSRDVEKDNTTKIHIKQQNTYTSLPFFFGGVPCRDIPGVCGSQHGKIDLVRIWESAPDVGKRTRT